MNIGIKDTIDLQDDFHLHRIRSCHFFCNDAMPTMMLKPDDYPNQTPGEASSFSEGNTSAKRRSPHKAYDGNFVTSIEYTYLRSALNHYKQKA